MAHFGLNHSTSLGWSGLGWFGFSFISLSFFACLTS